MLTTHLKLVPPLLRDAEPESPSVRLSIQGRHGVYLVQQNGDEVIINATDPNAPHCTCHLRPGAPADECEHIALLRACGFLARAA